MTNIPSIGFGPTTIITTLGSKGLRAVVLKNCFYSALIAWVFMTSYIILLTTWVKSSIIETWETLTWVFGSSPFCFNNSAHSTCWSVLDRVLRCVVRTKRLDMRSKIGPVFFFFFMKQATRTISHIFLHLTRDLEMEQNPEMLKILNVSFLCFKYLHETQTKVMDLYLNTYWMW